MAEFTSAEKVNIGYENEYSTDAMTGGRKKGSGTGRKYKTFSFSCSPEEYEAIKARIEASGLKPSHFFVKKCLE